MSHTTPEDVTVSITIRVTVDPLNWATTHGLLESTEPATCNIKKVRQDIRQSFLTLALAMVEEVDGAVNGIRPDPSVPVLPPALVCQEDGTYLRVANGSRTPVEIDLARTENHSYNCDDGDLLVTTDGAVYRRDDADRYFQRQGPCCGDTVGPCDKTGYEVIDEHAFMVDGDHDTMIICDRCAKSQTS